MNGSETIDSIEVFRKYTALEWNNWIADAINKHPVFPYGYVTLESDLFRKVYELLESSYIDTGAYEIAIEYQIQKLKPINANSDSYFLLLSVIAYAKIGSLKKVLIDLLFDRNFTYLVTSRGNVIKNKLLQTVTRLTNLSEADKTTIQTYVSFSGLEELKDQPSFAGNYLRFLRVQYPGKSDFFNGVTQIIQWADSIFNRYNSLNDDYYKIKIKYINNITESIIELHYHFRAIFYSTLYNWLKEDFEKLLKNSFYKALLTSLYSEFSQTYYETELSIHHNTEGEKGRLVLFILSVITGQDTRNFYSTEENVNLERTFLQMDSDFWQYISQYSYMTFGIKISQIGEQKLVGGMVEDEVWSLIGDLS